MKPTKTKHVLREELNREIQAFLDGGGEVECVARGVSGNLDNKNLFTFAGSDSNMKSDRTPLTEVVKALEKRKKSGVKPANKKKAKPQKKLITDDFGEPIRWVWEDR